jgi:hypothetical protein
MKLTIIDLLNDLLNYNKIDINQYHSLFSRSKDFHNSEYIDYKIINNEFFIEVNDELTLNYRLVSGLNRIEKRQLRNINDNFIEIYNFYLEGYSKGLFDFCGTNVKTVYNSIASNSMICFKKYEQGEYSKETIYQTGIQCSQSDELRKVILGKKGFGLVKELYCSGIAEWSFTEEEILNEFKIRNINIPEPFLLDFRKTWRKKRDEIIFKNI